MQERSFSAIIRKEMIRKLICGCMNIKEQIKEQIKEKRE